MVAFLITGIRLLRGKLILFWIFNAPVRHAKRAISSRKKFGKQMEIVARQSVEFDASSRQTLSCQAKRGPLSTANFDCIIIGSDCANRPSCSDRASRRRIMASATPSGESDQTNRQQCETARFRNRNEVQKRFVQRGRRNST